MLERYWVADGVLKQSDIGGLVKYDDAKQAVERLEREVVKWQEVASLRTAGDAKFLREMELLKKDKADLQSQLAAKQKAACNICWTVSWVPIDPKVPKEVDVNYLAEGLNLYRCDYCWLKQQVAQLQEEVSKAGKDYAACRDSLDRTVLAHTTLRGLVEKLPMAGLPVEHSRPDDFIVMKDGEGWLVYTYNYWARFATEDEAKAYAALLQYRATLPREGGAQS